jgi:hypothetical protein
LTVHHCIYVKGVAPWEYDASLLLTLCADPCHMRRQDLERKARMAHATVLAVTPLNQIEAYTWAELAHHHKTTTSSSIGGSEVIDR